MGKKGDDRGKTLPGAPGTRPARQRTLTARQHRPPTHRWSPSRAPRPEGVRPRWCGGDRGDHDGVERHGPQPRHQIIERPVGRPSAPHPDLQLVQEHQIAELVVRVVPVAEAAHGAQGVGQHRVQREHVRGDAPQRLVAELVRQEGVGVRVHLLHARLDTGAAGGVRRSWGFGAEIWGGACGFGGCRGSSRICCHHQSTGCPPLPPQMRRCGRSNGGGSNSALCMTPRGGRGGSTKRNPMRNGEECLNIKREGGYLMRRTEGVGWGGAKSIWRW